MTTRPENRDSGRLRVLFFGAGAFGLPTLKMLADKHELLAVISQPDRPAGRKRVLTPTPISDWSLNHFADDHDTKLLRTEDVNTAEHVTWLDAWQADVAVVIAFGQKLSPEVIGSSGKLVVNLHASLLPKYRGAAPINWAMINEEKETGNSVIALAQRMDAGTVYAQNKTEIDPLETIGELHDRLSEMGPEVIEQVLQAFQAGALKGIEQDESLTCKAPKLSKTDGTVHFNQKASTARARIHGLTPWPGIRVKVIRHGSDETLEMKILRVRSEDMDLDPYLEPGIFDGERIKCLAGGITLLEVQVPGGKALAFEDFQRGQHALKAGDQLIAWE